MIRLLNLYLGRQLFTHMGLVLVVFMALVSLSEFLTASDWISDRFPLLQALWWVVLKWPMYLNMLFPVAVILAVVMAVGALAKTNEWTVYRIGGLSPWQLSWWIWRWILVMWLALVAMQQSWLPQSQWQGQALTAYAKGQAVPNHFRGEQWFRQPNQMIKVQQVVNTSTLRGVQVIQHDEQGKVTEVIEAKLAILTDQGWLLKDSTTQRIQRQAVSDAGDWLSLSQQHQASQSMVLPIEPTYLESARIAPSFMSYSQLWLQWRFLRQNQLNGLQLELVLWERLSLPLVLLAMIMIVLPFVMGSQRSMSIGQRIFLGIITAVVYYLLSQLLNNLILVNQWSPAMVYSFWTLGLFIIGWQRIRRIN